MNESIDRDLENRTRKVEEQNHERAKEVAVLRADMNTKQAEYATAAERLTGETRSAIERLRTDMARRDAEAGKRENRMLLAILGGIAAATTILGVLIAGIPAA